MQHCDTAVMFFIMLHSYLNLPFDVFLNQKLILFDIIFSFSAYANAMTRSTT